MFTPEKPNKSRWRKRNIEGRARVKSKTRRNLGHSYIDFKGRQRESKVLGPPCQCKKNCRQLLQETASTIFHAFWDLNSYDEQNTYLFSTVKQIVEGRTTPKRDGRGKHQNRPNKISAERVQSVHDHIKAIPKYVSHYSRKVNPNRVFLNHDLNISTLYKDYYVEWCKERGIAPVKEDRYRRIFCSDYNIGFKLPKSDTCHTCDFLNNQMEANKENLEEFNEFKTQLQLHQTRALAMQDSLKKEVSDNAKNSTCIISFDLQQTLPTPSLTVGPAFYLRKAWTYNLGIHDCVTGKGSMFLWAEPTAKRGSEEIASILLKYLQGISSTKEHLVVFTDNCGGQNKNWVIMSLWLQLVREGFFKSIEHRFLIPGHTHLPSDRDFAIIEKHKRGSRLGSQRTLTDLRRKYNGPLALNDKKIKDLKKLLKYIPPISQQFFVDIVGNTTEAEPGSEQPKEGEEEAEDIDGDDEEVNLD
ncbi:unnamed protein product [Acanthoscelides obtectus]|uniref:DUF7869 domain-containing protein n=1 Tax=Acanthoscelides obtectus TaxID=200917 RepID=A0A9P0M5P9_ACAOB|nr:unnamed protein product [Acanthoscelides obtectus]CAK1638573.1 hypothetical protein AOBTE_LOCUS10674 [Acanthoscelides obtectus]